jgi:hypothetical protein
VEDKDSEHEFLGFVGSNALHIFNKTTEEEVGLIKALG